MGRRVLQYGEAAAVQPLKDLSGVDAGAWDFGELRERLTRDGYIILRVSGRALLVFMGGRVR